MSKESKHRGAEVPHYPASFTTSQSFNLSFSFSHMSWVWGSLYQVRFVNGGMR